MPNVVDRFNVGGEEYHIEPVLVTEPIEDSPNGITSGGVYQALQDSSPLVNPSLRAKVFGKYIGSAFRATPVPDIFSPTDWPSWSDAAGDVLVIGTGQRGPIWTDDNCESWHAVFDYTSGNINVNYLKCVHGVWFVSVYFSNGNVYTYYSLDGRVWAQTNLPDQVDCVDYGLGVFVAAVKSNKGLWWSEDGITWTASNVSTGTEKSVAYGQSFYDSHEKRFMTAHYYSLDGKNWSNMGSTPSKLDAIAYGAGVWLGADATNNKFYRGGMGHSWDEITGVTIPGSSSTGTSTDIIFAAGIFVITVQSRAMFIARPDLKSSVSAPVLTSYEGPRHIAYKNGMFVGGFRWSNEGYVWHEAAVFDTNMQDLWPMLENVTRNMAFYKGRWISVWHEYVYTGDFEAAVAAGNI